MLSDDVLLIIFDFYVHQDVNERRKQTKEVWITLVHVCRRWRTVVFQSPLRLNLRLFCTPKTPTREVLDIWPPLPLIIRDFENKKPVKPFIEDNIIAALEHNDRVCEIQFLFTESGYFTNSAAILQPFPELTFLRLTKPDRYADEEPEPILPDSFLGGSAPRLLSFILKKVSFPGLPKLLMSTPHLVFLDLSIPRSGYIPPEVMATSLSALTTLQQLLLHFDSPPPRPDLETRRTPPPPLTCSILPSLTIFEFKGASEYLEATLARIGAPLLNELRLIFFNQLIFDTPQLFQFISRSPILMTKETGSISFESKAIVIGFASHPSDNDVDVFNIGIRSEASEWQLSSLEQVCNSSLPPLSTLENLYISERRYDRLDWQDDVENTLWLDLLRPFVAVKNLYISKKFMSRIAPALQELVGGRTTEVLPALENIFLHDPRPTRPLQEGIEKFVAARRLTSRPVTVTRSNKGFPTRDSFILTP